MPQSSPKNGWINLDKPLGLSSMQALARVKRALGHKKAGHAGTLDPLATGVLPIALGEATKLIDLVMDHRKTYEFTVAWGVATSTDDAEGHPVATSDSRPSVADIQAVLPKFVGCIMQRPPAFSALKIDGQRAYDLARKGQNVMLAERPVDVFSLTLSPTPLEGGETSTFTLTCGKGTYVRSLARDLAVALGTVGHVTHLRRTATGPFNLENILPLDRLQEMGHTCAWQQVLPVGFALDDILALPITAPQSKRLKQGLPIAAETPEGIKKVACLEKTPVAIVGYKDGQWWPWRGLNISCSGTGGFNLEGENDVASSEPQSGSD